MISDRETCTSEKNHISDSDQPLFVDRARSPGCRFGRLVCDVQFLDHADFYEIWRGDRLFLV